MGFGRHVSTQPCGTCHYFPSLIFMGASYSECKLRSNNYRILLHFGVEILNPHLRADFLFSKTG